jgi:predicted lysophospholipase L1 biosynthesis ABC-type transport system permease subunit
MGIALVAGRTINENDRRPVVIVSERVANVMWPGASPIGRQLMDGGKAREVIGVAGDVRAEAHRPAVATIYRPYWDYAPRRVMMVARAAGDPRSIAGAMREAVRAVDRDVPLAQLRTMQEVLEESVAQRRFQMLLASAFGAAALLLASLGIYGVVSYSVARRTGEMGVRMALGAQARDVYAMVIGQAMAPVAAGLAAGIAAALAVGRVLASLLYEVSPRDPGAIAAVAALLLVVGLAACLPPARRATRVDPLVALRYE